jgi:hypothetical protein
MYTGTLYLNNNGSRWINYTNGVKDSITLKNKQDQDVTRKVNFYQSFGNFATANISYKGNRINVFADSILD